MVKRKSAPATKKADLFGLYVCWEKQGALVKISLFTLVFALGVCVGSLFIGGHKATGQDKADHTGPGGCPPAAKAAVPECCKPKQETVNATWHFDPAGSKDLGLYLIQDGGKEVFLGRWFSGTHSYRAYDGKKYCEPSPIPKFAPVEYVSKQPDVAYAFGGRPACPGCRGK